MNDSMHQMKPKRSMLGQKQFLRDEIPAKNNNNIFSSLLKTEKPNRQNTTRGEYAEKIFLKKIGLKEGTARNFVVHQYCDKKVFTA